MATASIISKEVGLTVFEAELVGFVQTGCAIEPPTRFGHPSQLSRKREALRATGPSVRSEKGVSRAGVRGDVGATHCGTGKSTSQTHEDAP